MKNTTQEIQTVNSLTHTIRRRFENATINGHQYPLITVKAVIKLADECKNGHNDFSITGSIWEGEICNDRNSVTSGAIGDHLAQLMPELKIFNDLHLSDVNGTPMHGIANGLYHLQTGKPEYTKSGLRLTNEEFDLIKNSEDQDFLAYTIQKIGVIDRWKSEANQAIAILEEMTGQKFKDNSTKLRPAKLPKARFEAIERAIGENYYSPERIQARKDGKLKAQNKKILKGLIEDRDKEILKANTEFKVKKAVFDAGLPLDSFIYYNHTNEGHFNWRSYGEKITYDQLSAFIKQVDYSALPKGIKFQMSKNK